MLKICNLSKTYSGSSVKALDDLSLTIEKGEIFGFLGPNGAGKSTAIKCITGILAYNDGSIFIDGVDLNKDPVGAKKKIGYVADNHTLYEGLTARQYIDFIADVFEVSIEDRKARIAKYAEVFNLTDKLDDRISTFSHGMKQKVSVISALVHEPDVFILDEPMLGLDPAATFELKKIMLEYASQGKVVFFSSHILDVVEKLCTRIGIIDGGKLVAVCDMQELKEKRSDISLENLFLNLTKREDNE